MDKLKLVSILLICNILLSSCGLCPKSIANSQQNNKKNETNIENLTNGSYLFCSDRHPNEDKIDAHRYCFTFTKTGKKIIGSYLYRAPKDTPVICVEGTVKDNLLNGFGYENIGPNSDPYTEEDFSYLNRLPINNYLSFWDDVEHYQGGLNLKAGRPSLYKLSPPSEDKYASFWATIRYKNVQLDLRNFEQIQVDSLPEFTNCTNW